MVKRVSVLFVFVCALFLLQFRARSQDQAMPASTLPINRVTLFTSGVSYTERLGSVTNSAEVPLTFHTAQINDILKSMVLLDSGGKVQPATFATRDPISRSLQSFAVDVSQNSTIDEILCSLRGEIVSISEAGKLVAEGPIVGVEKRDLPPADKDGNAVQGSFITLMTDSGLTAIPLDGLKTVKVLDERLDHEFREALKLLASSNDDQKRQVMLHFAGVGKRNVRVGYVTEAPIWKISYRLVIGGQTPGSKPYLQGWALVENSTDEDWKGVSLSLVSGRPVSFIQDLYQPLYIPRPVVGPDIVASPTPQTHEENMLAEKRDDQQPAKKGKQSITATVLNINGETIILNAGVHDGIVVGDKLQVYRDDGNGGKIPVGELLVQRAYAKDSQAVVVKNTGGIRPEDTAEEMYAPKFVMVPNQPQGLPEASQPVDPTTGIQADTAFRKSVSAQATGQRAGRNVRL